MQNVHKSFGILFKLNQNNQTFLFHILIVFLNYFLYFKFEIYLYSFLVHI